MNRIPLHSAVLGWLAFCAGAGAAAPTPDEVPRADVVFVVERHGEIRVRVDPPLAPNHCAQFLTNAADGTYRGRAFHRVIPGFIVQSGEKPGTVDSTASPAASAGSPRRLPAEGSAGSLPRGSVVMAWRGCTPGTALDEFFICLVDLPALAHCGTRIGQVVAGMEVVDRIAQASTDPEARPLRSISIDAVRVEPASGAPPKPAAAAAPPDSSDEASAESSPD